MQGSTPVPPRPRRIYFKSSFLLPLWLLISVPASPAADRAAAAIDAATLERVYEEVKTPFKYGIVLRGASNQMVDCPSLFRHGPAWYMMYVAITDKTGYETFLARSEDLLNWRTLGKVLSFAGKGWDAWQADGGVALVDPRWGGSAALGRYKGRYWMSYLGAAYLYGLKHGVFTAPDGDGVDAEGEIPAEIDTTTVEVNKDNLDAFRTPSQGAKETMPEEFKAVIDQAKGA